MAFDIEKFKTLSPEAQRIVFDRKGVSPEAQQIIMQKVGSPSPLTSAQMTPVTTGQADVAGLKLAEARMGQEPAKAGTGRAVKIGDTGRESDIIRSSTMGDIPAWKVEHPVVAGFEEYITKDLPSDTAKFIAEGGALAGQAATLGLAYPTVKRIGRNISSDIKEPGKPMDWGQFGKDYAEGWGYWALGKVVQAVPWIAKKIPGLKTATTVAEEVPLSKYGKGAWQMGKDIAEAEGRYKLKWREINAGKQLINSIDYEKFPGIQKNIAENIAEVEALKARYPGYTPSFAQEVGTRKAIAQQKSLYSRSDVAKDYAVDAELKTNTQLKSALKIVDTDNKTIENTITTLKKGKAKLNEAETSAIAALEESKAKLAWSRQQLIDNAVAKREAKLTQMTFERENQIAKAIADREAQAEVLRLKGVKLAETLKGKSDKEISGGNIRQLALDKLKIMHDKMDKIYGILDRNKTYDIVEGIGDEPGIMDSMRNIVIENEELVRGMNAATPQARQLISSLMKGDAEVTGVKLGALRDLDSHLSKMQRAYVAGNKFNDARLVGEMRASINKTLRQDDEVAKILDAGAKYMREDFAPTWYQLNSGWKGARAKDISGGYVSEDIELGKKFFISGEKGKVGIRQYKKVSENNMGQLNDYIQRDFYDNVFSESTQTLNFGKGRAWIDNHKYALKEAGLLDNYKNSLDAIADIDFITKSLPKDTAIARTFPTPSLPQVKPSDFKLKKPSKEITYAVEKAAKNRANFESSAAQKILNADVNTVVPNMLSGSNGRYGKAMQELQLQIKQSADSPAEAEAAWNGAREAFKKYLYNEWEKIAESSMTGDAKTRLSTTERVFKKYEEAIKVMFNKPGEFTTMSDINRINEIMGYQTKNVIGGSETSMFANDPNGRIRRVLLTAGSIWLKMPGTTWAVNHLDVEIQRKLVEDVLAKAYFDPSYRKLIIEAANAIKAGDATRKVSRELTRKGLALGAGIYEQTGQEEKTIHLDANGNEQ